MPAAVRRQPRGQRRMGEILDAAAAVFARTGVERATTNAIAAEAGISPGSLYQYFRDRDDIVAALGLRYAHDLEQAHAAAFAGTDPTSGSTAEVLDRILEPIVAFKQANLAFAAVFARPDLPDTLTQPVGAVEQVFSERLTEVLQVRNPDVSPTEVATVARTVIVLVGSALGGPEGTLAEVRIAVLGYLDRKGLR